MYAVQIEGKQGPFKPVFRCTARLPGSGGLTGSVPWDWQNWCWGARYRSFISEWTSNQISNDDRSWYYYQGPLRYYEVGGWVACTEWDVNNNAWDLWGDSWRGNSSISPEEPFNTPSPVNSAVFYRRTKKLRVMLYCPEAVRVPDAGGSPWWHDWRAPHRDQPWSRDAVRVTPYTDARNYLFNDGHVLFYAKKD